MEKEIYIENINKRGYGIGFSSNTKVEVPHAIIDDLANVHLHKKRKGLIKGRLLQIVKPSKYRVAPKCTHTTICGGCTLQEMDYSKQLKEKEKFILQCFGKNILQTSCSLYPMISSEDPWFYRNKMEFSFSENRAKTKFLGLMIANANRYVFNVEKCFLCAFWFTEVLQNVREFWENSNLKAYDFADDSGHFRYLTIREGKNTNEKMVILTVSGNKEYNLSDNDIENLKNAIYLVDENISFYIRKQKIEKRKATVFEETHIAGPTFIKEKLYIDIKGEKKELTFKISPSSFFQPNTKQAEKLYSAALSLLDKDKFDTVLDLYCGTGTLGMAFSFLAKKVIGIELNNEAVKDAKENILLNNIDNITLYQGDVGKTLENLNIQEAELVIVDPPRSGLDEMAIKNILSIKPKIIVYVSCNPLTQSENVEEFLSNGYFLEKMQPVDQFPHTFHIENIAILKR